MIHNFNAGPSILPKEVFEQASAAVLNFNDTGLSILEIGHRTEIFKQVINEAIEHARFLMQLDDDQEVIFLPGGASTQFFQVPMNLLNEQEIAAYADTGIWASKAIKEARLFGHVDVVCSGEEFDYRRLPADFKVPKTARYLHITTNNTIHGTQWQDLTPFYDAGVPLVADMSSDILSRRIAFNKFDLIYAGAQKNVGAAGVNLVIVRRNLLGHVTRKLPTMMDYRNHIEANSLLNTPPVFAIYVCMLTLRWLRGIGGVEKVEECNRKKAELLYSTLDQLPLFSPTVFKGDRSLMNVCFNLRNPALEEKFIEECKQNGMVGVKGHRTVGGLRVSLYNALPLESVKSLVELMKDFAARH